MKSWLFTRFLSFSVWASKSLFDKLYKTYERNFHKKLPVVLVTGTLGKSSVTLLLHELFEQNGYEVISGASKGDNLNTIFGLTMVLSGEERYLLRKNKVLGAILYTFSALGKLIFGRYRLSEKSIFLFEIGYNDNRGAELYYPVFKDKLELLIVTACTWEHAAFFPAEFAVNEFRTIQNHLPKVWQEIFLDPAIDGKIKNIALEQFKICECGGDILAPTQINQVENSLVFKSNLSEEYQTVQVSRDGDLGLKTDKYTFSSQYLLPQTFARNGLILDLVAKKYDLAAELVSQLLKNLSLPNGRFSLLNGQNGSTIVDSTYNSDPASLNSFLEIIREIIPIVNKLEKYVLSPKHYLILGEMRELGATAKPEHEKALRLLIALNKQFGDYIENTYLLGSEWLKCDVDSKLKVDGAISYIFFEGQTWKVLAKAGDINREIDKQGLRPNSWVWLKGSQNTIFLEIVAEHLLMNKEDKERLCRRGESWDQLRQKYI